jgi:hypothetical protein
MSEEEDLKKKMLEIIQKKNEKQNPKSVSKDKNLNKTKNISRNLTSANKRYT